MKIILSHASQLLLWLTFLGFSCPGSYAQQVALYVPDLPQQKEGRMLSSVLSELEKAYDINFYYNIHDVEEKYVAPDFNVNVEKSLSQTLKEVLDRHALDFEKVENGYYFIFTTDKKNLPQKIQKKPLLPSEQGVRKRSGTHTLEKKG
jgi:hypothetical protein